MAIRSGQSTHSSVPNLSPTRDARQPFVAIGPPVRYHPLCRRPSSRVWSGTLGISAAVHTNSRRDKRSWSARESHRTQGQTGMPMPPAECEVQRPAWSPATSRSSKTFPHDGQPSPARINTHPLTAFSHADLTACARNGANEWTCTKTGSASQPGLTAVVYNWMPSDRRIDDRDIIPAACGCDGADPMLRHDVGGGERGRFSEVLETSVARHRNRRPTS